MNNIVEDREKMNIELEQSGPSWTPEQLDAIERRGENLLVAAAAGSGKTSVMVERIRRMVCDEDVPIESLLVVTFTNAAAAEMKERIRRALSEALDTAEPNSERSKNLRKQIRNLPLANISTFHSFGMSVIKRFFYLTDADPGTRVGEETEFAILKEEALDALIEDEFEKSDESFIEFMDNYSGDRSDYKIRALIMDANKKIGAMPHGMDWAYERVHEMENIRECFPDSGFWKTINGDIKAKLDRAVLLTEQAAEILNDTGLEEKSLQLREMEIARYHEASACFDQRNLTPEEIMTSCGEILKAEIPRLTSPKGELAEVYKEVKDSVQKFRGEARKIIRDDIIKRYFAGSMDEVFRETEMVAEQLKELLRLTARFRELYAERKRDSRVMDFDDIEHYALDILEHDEASEYYRDKLRYIFVDEYQDTNLMQEAIINRIKGESNLFMVGDIKQSIYRFRLAEPSIFQEKYERFKAGEESKSAVIDLNRNHRSKSTIVDFINDVFRPIMSDYDEDAELHCGVNYDGKLLRNPEIHIVMPNILNDEPDEPDENDDMAYEVEFDDDFDDAEPAAWDKVYLEARHVAKIIKENLGKDFFDSKAKEPIEKPLEKRDIVVLMRSISNYAGLYSQALQEEGIDAYLEGDDGYFDTMEIGAFINLLAVIDNIKQDVPLLSVLHSGIFGFTSKELAEIRLLCRDGSFADAFMRLAADECDGSNVNGIENDSVIEENEKTLIIKKCATVLEKLIYWQKLSFTMPLDKYIWRLMLESNCYISMGALPRGDARQANLRALCDMAEKYTAEKQATLYGFLNYVNAIKKGRVKTPEVSKLGEGDDVVRIMTIHKSKGLEFPMVILSGLGNKKSYGRSGTLRMHKDIGLAIPLRSGRDHWQKDIMLQYAISSLVKKEEIEEEIRILYVGLTRARDILYLVGYEDKDMSEFAENGIVSHNQYMTMILPGRDYKVFLEGRDINDKDDHADSLAIKKETHASELTDDRRRAILERLNYVYPFEEARRLKSKYSVSELNKIIAAETESTDVGDTRRTVFMASGNEDEGGILTEISAADRGTVYHKILERIDFINAKNQEYISVAIKDMEKRGILSEEEIAAIDIRKVEGFFKSEIGRRAISAAEKGLLEKERPFTMIIEKEGEEVLVQGIIDCYFREKNEDKFKTVLLDYKSNKVYEDRTLEEEINRISHAYAGQMNIYKTALEEAGLGQIDEAYLYLLDIGAAIVM